MVFSIKEIDFSDMFTYLSAVITGSIQFQDKVLIQNEDHARILLVPNYQNTNDPPSNLIYLDINDNLEDSKYELQGDNNKNIMEVDYYHRGFPINGKYCIVVRIWGPSNTLIKLNDDGSFECKKVPKGPNVKNVNGIPISPPIQLHDKESIVYFDINDEITVSKIIIQSTFNDSSSSNDNYTINNTPTKIYLLGDINGKIFCMTESNGNYNFGYFTIPESSATNIDITELDSNNDIYSITNFEDFDGAVECNGKLVLTPKKSNSVIIFDGTNITKTDIPEHISDPSSTIVKYRDNGIVVDDKVIFTPYDIKYIGIYDTTKDTLLFVDINTEHNFTDAVRHNNKIYFYSNESTFSSADDKLEIGILDVDHAFFRKNNQTVKSSTNSNNIVLILCLFFGIGLFLLVASLIYHKDYVKHVFNKKESRSGRYSKFYRRK